MRLGESIVIGICTALAVIGFSDGGLQEARPRAAAPPPAPPYSLVRGVALQLLRGCASTRTVNRSTPTEVIIDFRCSGQDVAGRRQVVNVFTYLRARTGRTVPGSTTAKRYFVNQGVVVLPYGQYQDPTLPHVDAGLFVDTIRNRCHCGRVLTPLGA